jgi:hypothetical protein
MPYWNAYLSTTRINCGQSIPAQKSETPKYSHPLFVFERFGYIELVNSKTGMRKVIPEFLIDTIKRSKRQPIWIPSRNFPFDLSDIVKEMKPSMQGDSVVWRHIRSECRRLGQHKDVDTTQEH